MAMGRYLCQLCYSVVQYGERHPCFFYKDDDTAYTVPQPDKTEKVDTNQDETTGEYAENSGDNYGDMFDNAPQIRNISQASTSRVHSLPSEGKLEVDELSRDFSDRLVPPQASLHAANRSREMNVKVKRSIEFKQNVGAMAGPSAIPSKTIGPEGKAQYACDLCTYRCKSKWHLVRHYRTHTGEKPFDCNICGKKFGLKGSLNTHMKLHRGEKPFICDICGKKFTQKGNLKTHMSTHTGEMPFICDICGEKFFFQSSLNAHLKTHTNEKPFICGTCGKIFTQQAELDRHVRTHTGKKPFSCDICGRRFSEKSDCRMHVATHDEGKHYKCAENQLQ